MKFSLKKMLVSSVLAGAMTFCAAGAANFDSAAQSLSDLGLLSGTAGGFDLDRASTRGEAAAMLVRLLGKEAEANQLWETDADSFAFTDMEDASWAKPYVNWLVKNGLAAGTTDTTFAPRDNCSAQMAATFLLRALGYSDAEGGDFSYSTAMGFARQVGVVDLFNCDEKDFQRDHLVAMSYTALSRPVKGTETDLLTKLVADGAIEDSASSKALQQRFADYREMSAVNAKLSQDISMAFKLKADIDISALLLDGGEPSDGGSMKMGVEEDIAMKVDIAAPDAMEMSAAGSVTITADGETVTIPSTMYFKDGTAYMESNGQKMQLPMSMQEAYEQIGAASLQGAGSEPITAIDTMSKSTEGGKTVYELTYNPKVMNSAIKSMMGSVAASLPDLNDPLAETAVDKIVCRSTVEGDMPSNIDMDMILHISDGQNKVTMDIKMVMDITAIGDAVKVEFPASFDGYVDIGTLA